MNSLEYLVTNKSEYISQLAIQQGGCFLFTHTSLNDGRLTFCLKLRPYVGLHCHEYNIEHHYQ